MFWNKDILKTTYGLEDSQKFQAAGDIILPLLISVLSFRIIKNRSEENDYCLVKVEKQ